MRQNIAGHSPYETSTGFSRAVRIGDRVISAGTAPIASDGSTAHPHDPFHQTLACFEIIRAAFENAGATLDDVVQTRMFITSASFADEVSRAHGTLFGSIRPAATMVVVAGLLRDDWTVEVEAEAVVGVHP